MYEFIKSPNFSSRKGNSVGGVIAHSTAWGEMNGTVRYLCNRVRAPANLTKGIIIIDGKKYYKANASSHYITGRSGRTVILVPESEAAWHAGSRTTKPQLNNKGNLNVWTIGHEICNWGGLRKDGDNFYCWPGGWTYKYEGPAPFRWDNPKPLRPALDYRFDSGKSVFPEGVIEYWEPYPIEQISAIIKLWQDIVDRYQITKEWIAGHDKVDPTRKIDPGPAFPWEDIISQVFPKLNITKPDLLYSIPEGEPPESELIIRHGESRKEASFVGSICNIFK